MKTPVISLVVAMSKQTRAIGKNQNLLWRIPRDLRHFKEVTTGHPVIMGRSTFDSIGKVLPGRANIVITRNTSWSHDGVIVCHSFEEALQEALKIDGAEIAIIGGGQIFELAMPVATRIYLTLVDDEQVGDAHFPFYDESQFVETAREVGEHEGISYSILTLDRISPQTTPNIS